MSPEVHALANRLQVDLEESFLGTVWVRERATDGIEGALIGRCVPFRSPFRSGHWYAYGHGNDIVGTSESLHDCILDVVGAQQ